MANPLKGEVDLSHDGVTYCLRFTVDAIIQLEAHMGSTVGEIGNKALAINVTALHAMFWAALLPHHQLSQKDVADLMDDIGIIKASSATMEAFGLSFPSEDANAPARPQKKTKAGTG